MDNDSSRALIILGALLAVGMSLAAFLLGTSLIGAATQNARARAEELAKNGGVKTGAMRNASQGAFYILPARANNGSATTVVPTTRVRWTKWLEW